MGLTLQMQKYIPVEQGYYRGIVTEVESTEGQYGPQLKWKFELLDEEHAGHKLTAWCSAVLSPKSKLNRWATAILGSIPADGMLDVDDLVNAKVMLDVIVEQGKDGEFNKVREVLPWKKPQRPIPQRPAQPVQPVKAAPIPAYDEDAPDYTPADEAAALADTSSSIF